MPWFTDVGLEALRSLAETEAAAGSYWQAISDFDIAIRHARRVDRGWLFPLLAELAELHATVGDLKASQGLLSELQTLQKTSWSWKDVRPEQRAMWDARVASAEAAVFELQGRFLDGEQGRRRAISILQPFARADSTQGRWCSYLLSKAIGRLSGCLLRQDRLLEAEATARQALRMTVETRTESMSFTFETAGLVIQLARVLREQGRHAQAERLAREAIRMYAEGGATPEGSPSVLLPRRELAALLAAQGQWSEALGEYTMVREQLRDDGLFARLATSDLAFMLTLIKVGRESEIALDGPENSSAVRDLRDRIERLAHARDALARDIAKQFPGYALLVNPPPATVEQVRRVLRPQEALVATLVTEDTTYVWALRQTGRVAVAAVPIGARALAVAVGELR